MLTTDKYAAALRAAGRKFDRLVAAGKIAAALRAHSRDLRVAGADYDATAAPRGGKGDMTTTTTTTYSIDWRATTEEGFGWTLGAPDSGTLDEVCGWCQDAGVSATLYDAAGFRRGHVHADGSYRLF